MGVATRLQAYPSGPSVWRAAFLLRFISSLLGVRNLEITTSEDLAAFLRKGARTYTGMEVGVRDAQAVSSWFAGNRNIAEDIGKLPFILYHAGEDRRRATDSRFWRLVHDRVSTRWTSQAFREYLTFWAQQDGDGYALKEVQRNGEVRELLPFKRGEVEKEVTDDNEFVYHVKLNGKKVTLDRRRIFHLSGFAMEYDSGAQLFRMSREDIGLSLATERHGGAFFGNGAQPSGGFKIPAALSDQAYNRLRDSLHEETTGANAWSPLLLEEGAEWQQFEVSNEQSQFLETRKFQVVEHARRLRIPPHKVSDLERATFSNIEHQAIEYVQDSLLPWALRWESAFNYQVINSPAVYAEMLFDVLLRGDSDTRAKVYAAAIQNGWMTQNDVRRRENLPPVAGGDVLFSPLNQATPRDRELAQLKLQTESLGNLIRAGFEPLDSLKVCGLPAIAHTGRLPVTVQSATSAAEEELASV